MANTAAGNLIDWRTFQAFMNNQLEAALALVTLNGPQIETASNLFAIRSMAASGEYPWYFLEKFSAERR